MNKVQCRACLNGIEIADNTLGLGAGSWHQCLRCATLNWWPLPKNHELDEHYAGAYSDDVGSVPDFVRLRLREIVDDCLKRDLPNRRVLDVGFGEGDLLAEFALRDWACVGTELSKASLSLGASRNWEVHTGKEFFKTRIAPVSIVALFEVLEHLRDPEATLARVRELLLSGGVLIGTTPNAGSLNRRVLQDRWTILSPPEHLTVFSKGGLEAILVRTGFDVETIASRGLYPGEMAMAARASLGRKGLPRSTELETDRVSGSYALNEALVTRPMGRLMKRVANKVLAATDLGDTLSFSAC